MSTPLGTLTKLSPRAVIALRAAGLDTLEAAAAKTDEELLALHGVAAASVQRIRAWQAGEPEAESVSAPAADRLSRIWDAYRELVTLRDVAPGAAYARAVSLVDAFDKQSEVQP
jgi:hypothetical protein